MNFVIPQFSAHDDWLYNIAITHSRKKIQIFYILDS